MGRKVLVALIALVFSLAPAMASNGSAILWKGSVCSGVQYQKSIESVALSGDRVYVGCSYRQLANASGMIGIYYLGYVSTYSLNGTPLWQNYSGYVIKLQPLTNGNLLVGSMGGLVVFDAKGRFVSKNITFNKLYDFAIRDGKIYVGDGDLFVENGTFSLVGHVYSGRVVNGTAELNGWTLNLSEMVSRVRAGDGIIYAGSGFPSGYRGPFQFGSVYGILPNGTLEWSINLGHWVRDMEVYKGDLIAGTGYNSSLGNVYRVSRSGEILWNESLLYVEDIEIGGDAIYVGGMSENGGVVVALDPSSGKLLWRREFPYRVKVLRYANDVLLAGTGKFETRVENGTSMVYSVGALYALDPKNGEILGELPDTGYVRSVAVSGDTAVVGTASSNFYVLDLGALTSHKKSICGPALLLLLTLLPLLGRRS